jgi:hypothetical protein
VQTILVAAATPGELQDNRNLATAELEGVMRLEQLGNLQRKRNNKESI